MRPKNLMILLALLDLAIAVVDIASNMHVYKFCGNPFSLFVHAMR